MSVSRAMATRMEGIYKNPRLLTKIGEDSMRKGLKAKDGVEYIPVDKRQTPVKDEKQGNSFDIMA